MAKIGIIGGTGFENPDILKNIKTIQINTPFGKPGSELKSGTINNIDVVLVSRHGLDHTISPTNVNNRANIWALKEIECTHIIATSACGSLREKIERGDIVFPDQFIDFTKFRANTFFETFEKGKLKHTPMSDPFDENLRSVLIVKAKEAKLKYHPHSTIITIEGPRFSTRAESKMFRSWGADIINMSTAPECILANELKIPYAVIALSTDYDCWKTDEEPVTFEEVLYVFNKNVNNVIALITNSLPSIK